ncbi:hypothetical protein [Christensenella minuta]|uniref:hypothetical protein n=1 Tax=Christensenella minuta TaxID=626937 RepID=UPI002157B1F2|nr:hypothetical protein [Christensenella minuta]
MERKKEFGMCKFCGTAIPVPLDLQDDPKEDKDEYATMNCSCINAENYQMKIRAKRRRKETLERASNQIEQLFGEGAREFGFEPVSSKIGGALRELSALAYDGEIEGATVNIPGNTKAAVKITSKGVITVLRQMTTAFKREV